MRLYDFYARRRLWYEYQIIAFKVKWEKGEREFIMRHSEQRRFAIWCVRKAICSVKQIADLKKQKQTLILKKNYNWIHLNKYPLIPIIKLAGSSLLSNIL